MWTVRIVQSAKVMPDNSIKSIMPRCIERTIVRLEDFVSTVEATDIDRRCISIIELESTLAAQINAEASEAMDNGPLAM